MHKRGNYFIVLFGLALVCLTVPNGVFAAKIPSKAPTNPLTQIPNLLVNYKLTTGALDNFYGSADYYGTIIDFAGRSRINDDGNLHIWTDDKMFFDAQWARFSQDVSVVGALNVDGVINLPNESIDGSKLKANARTVLDGGVTTAKLVDGSVTAAKIADGTITSADISSSAAIPYSKLSIADGDLTIAKTSGLQAALDAKLSSIGSSTITSAMLVDGTIVSADISASAAIPYSKLLIADGDLTIAKTSGLQAALDAKLSSIGSSTITSAMLTDGTIVNADISASADIALEKLEPGTAGQLVVATATGAKYVTLSGAATLSAEGGMSLNTDAVNTAALQDGSVTNYKLASDSVTTVKILNANVTNAKLASAAVTVDKQSTTARQKTVTVPVGTLAASGGTVEIPIFATPCAGTITNISFVFGATVTASADNYSTLYVQHNVGPAVIGSTNSYTGSFTGKTDIWLDPLANTTFTQHEVLVLKKDEHGTGQTLTNLLVVITYLPNEPS